MCLDGTSNKYGKKNSNLVELYGQLVKDSGQLTYYNSGIGTYAKPSWKSLRYWGGVIDHGIDLMIAWNFEKIIIGAYRWLVDNHKEGDRIFLFGFSRGAYQARCLAGMLDKVGLLQKGNKQQIPFAYELYADLKSDSIQPQHLFNMAHSVQSGSQPPLSPAAQFKAAFSRKVRVHFIGAWDTVSSVGIFREKNLPGSVLLGHTCFFRHALALDERRVKFLPEFAAGGAMMPELLTWDEPAETPHGAPHIKEVWFPGDHSDIGGGNVKNDHLDRRHTALIWMSYEAIIAGLKLTLNPSHVAWKWDNLNKIHNSLSFGWKILEYLPIPHLDYQSPDSSTWL
ncbi:hypothetical protein BU17DRAFT_74046 [Hysterangium stoloniferum]|nr:hypothetical protein BU17DRAFT_74046 [Hysterangium stoloniferum]